MWWEKKGPGTGGEVVYYKSTLSEDDESKLTKGCESMLTEDKTTNVRTHVTVAMVPI